MIWKITIETDESAKHEYRVSTMKEMLAFVTANFTDVPAMPNETIYLNIERILEFLPPDYRPNPDYHL